MMHDGNHASLSFTSFSCIVLVLGIGKRASICRDRLRRTKEENKEVVCRFLFLFGQVGSCIHVFGMMMGEFSTQVFEKPWRDQLQKGDFTFEGSFLYFLFMSFMLLVPIVMVNVLIASMQQSYLLRGILYTECTMASLSEIQTGWSPRSHRSFQRRNGSI